MIGIIFTILCLIVCTFLGINLGAEIVAKDLYNIHRINESELSEFSSIKYAFSRVLDIFKK